DLAPAPHGSRARRPARPPALVARAPCLDARLRADTERARPLSQPAAGDGPDPPRRARLLAPRRLDAASRPTGARRAGRGARLPRRLVARSGARPLRDRPAHAAQALRPALRARRRGRPRAPPGLPRASARAADGEVARRARPPHRERPLRRLAASRPGGLPARRQGG